MKNMLWRLRVVLRATFYGIFAVIVQFLSFLKLYELLKRLLKLGIKFWPKRKVALLKCLGFACERTCDYEHAKECYDEVCKLEPDNSFNYIELGFIYEKQNEVVLAIKNYERALESGNEFGNKFGDEIRRKIGRLANRDSHHE